MDATKALQTFKDVLKAIDAKRYKLELELDDALEQWEGLGRVGGQRDDHAAEFLKRLRSHVDGLHGFLGTVGVQLTEIIANPFDRKGA